MKTFLTYVCNIFFTSLFVFFLYGFATIEPAPIWEPPTIAAVDTTNFCIWIGGGVYCFDWPGLD